MNMNKRDLKTLKEKTLISSIDMNKKDLMRLSKSQPSNNNNEHEEIIKPIPPRGSVKSKPVPRKSVNQDIILPPKQFRDGCKRIPKPRQNKTKPKHKFNFDDDILQTGNQSLEKFKIISIQSMETKKFKSYTNEFKVKILMELDDIKEIYHILQELTKTVKRRRKLSDNDILRLVIQNEELPNAISTKFNKVEDFKVDDLETIINILEY